MTPTPHKEKTCLCGGTGYVDTGKGAEGPCPDCRPEKEKCEEAGEELFTAPHSGDCLDIGPVIGTYEELLKDNKPDDIKPAAEEGEEWEKEFEMNFDRDGFVEIKKIGDYEIHANMHPDKIKSFIRTLLSRTRKEATEEAWRKAASVVSDGQPVHDCQYVGCDDGCTQDKGGCDCRQQLINAAKEDGVEIEVCAK